MTGGAVFLDLWIVFEGWLLDELFLAARAMPRAMCVCACARVDLRARKITTGAHQRKPHALFLVAS